MANNRLIIIMIVCMLVIGFLGIFPPAGATDEGRLGATTITFGDAGSDTSLVETIPKESLILSASMKIEGKTYGGGSSSADHDFTNTTNNQGWYGDFTGEWGMPGKDPTSNYRDNTFTNQNNTQVSSSNDARMNTDANWQNGNAAVCPYHHFEFTVTEANIKEMNVSWEGFGYHNTGMGNYSGYGSWLYLWNFTEAAWKLLDSFTNANGGDRTLEGRLSASLEDFIDVNDKVQVLVLGINDHFMDMPTEEDYLRTDYIKVEAYYVIPPSLPTDPSLDVGNDGDLEWQETGPFSGMRTLGDADGFKTELQSLVDAGGPGPGTVDVVFKFSSESGGILEISEIDIQYEDDRPGFNTIPDKDIDEDVDADDLYDLNDYSMDNDGVGSLTYEVTYEEDDTKVDCVLDSDGHHLDFVVMAQDWYGTLEFEVKATDSKGHYNVSNRFTLNVNQVNDGPVLTPLTNRTVKAGSLFELSAEATDVDGDELTFSDDTDLFDIGQSDGAISFTPTEGQVGEHTIEITVSDGTLEANDTFILIVETSRSLFLDPVEGQTAIQDIQFSLQITTTYTGTMAEVFSDDSTLFDIDPDTGLISFIPTNDDVGLYNVNITVTTGVETDTMDVTFTVLNVNDPPDIDPIADITLDVGGTVDIQVTASDIDADEILTFSDDSDLFDIDPQTGRIHFVASAAGKHKPLVTVTDLLGATVSKTFNITIINPNSPPVIDGIDTTDNKTKFRKGKTVTLTARATDPDGDTLNYTWKDGDVVIGHDAKIELSGLEKGKHTITLTVSDGEETVSDTKEIEIVKRPRSKDIVPGFEVAILVTAILFVLVARDARGRLSGG